MNEGFKPCRIAMVVIVLLNLQNAGGQSLNDLRQTTNYCDNARFDTTDIFTNSQLQKSDVVFGLNTDWQGKQDTLHLLLYYPDKHVDTFLKRPLMVLIHGGGFFKGSYKGQQVDEQYFARKGFAVASIDYRLGWDVQCIPNNFTSADAIYRAMQDANAALRYLVANASQYRIDTSFIFLYGQSAGAVTSLMTQFINEDEFNSVFPGTAARLGHLNNVTNSLTNTFSIKGIASKSGGIFDTSFLNANEAVPVLMFHGTADSTVPYTTGHAFSCVFEPVVEGSMEIQKRLNGLGKIYELDYQVGAGHSNVYQNEDSFFYKRLSHFFKRILCNQFQEIIYQNKTLIQDAFTPCNTLVAGLKNKMDVTCINGSDGIISIARTGGVSPYQYKLNNKAYQNSNIFDNLPAGFYTVTTKDKRSCTTSLPVSIANGTALCTIPISSTRINSGLKVYTANIYPNPSSSFFTLNVESSSGANIEIVVNDVFGRNILHAKKLSKRNFTFGENFVSGTYFVKVIEGNNSKTFKVVKAR
jgi:poly(3-hydroxybutyrate) depolymerase